MKEVEIVDSTKVTKICQFRNGSRCMSVNRDLPSGASKELCLWWCNQPINDKESPIECDQAILVVDYKLQQR